MMVAQGVSSGVLGVRRANNFLVMARELGSSKEERSATSKESMFGDPETTTLIRRP
jgi:hypothetical protein